MNDWDSCPVIKSVGRVAGSMTSLQAYFKDGISLQNKQDMLEKVTMVLNARGRGLMEPHVCVQAVINKLLATPPENAEPGAKKAKKKLVVPKASCMQSLACHRGSGWLHR